MITIIIVLVAFVTVCLIMASKSKNKEKQIEQNVKDLQQKILTIYKDFKPTKIVQSGSDEFYTYYLGSDDNQKEVLCFSSAGNPLYHIKFGYADIMAAELILDGKVIQTKKSANLKSAVVGGVVAGKLGAVVAGVGMSSSTSSEHVSTIKVHIVLRNSSIAGFDIVFHHGCPLETTSILYQRAFGNAQKVLDILKGVIDKANEEPKNNTILHPKSSEDVLNKLKESKNKGLISEAEYEMLEELNKKGESADDILGMLNALIEAEGFCVLNEISEYKNNGMITEEQFNELKELSKGGASDEEILRKAGRFVSDKARNELSILKSQGVITEEKYEELISQYNN